MIDPIIATELASELDRAERDRRPIDHFSRRSTSLTIDDAYAIQRSWVEMKVRDGQTIVGRKIGLTSSAMQSAAGITEPDYGVLFGDMIFEDGSVISLHQFIAPRIEVEIAFVLDQDLLGPGRTVTDVMDSVAWVVPALEIIDTRFVRNDPRSGLPRTIVDTIADNAASAAVVLGGKPQRPDAVDLPWISAVMRRNNVLEESGVAAAVLNNPARAVAWLANRLSHHDEQLRAGDLVLSGSFTRSIPVGPGDTIFVQYSNLGVISCAFEAEGGDRA